MIVKYRHSSFLARIPRALLLLDIFILLAAGWGQPIFAVDRNKSISFSWALVYQDKDGMSKPIDYRKSVVRLDSGDKFKVYLKPMNPCHIYLYLYDSQRNLFLLFPEDFNLFDQNSQIARNYELPGVNSWFYLDENSGREVFYLIVSARRLEGLEQGTKQYLEGRTNRRGNLQTITYKHGVLDEIKRIIKESSYLSDAAEKPIAVAGDFRGVREEYELNGVSIETTDIYVKTIRLEH